MVAPPLPTLNVSHMTKEDIGRPAPEIENEPDPDNPGMTRHQAWIANHGQVHIMPLAVRQAQDRLIRAKTLNSRMRELVKPLAAFMDSDTPTLDELAQALDEMKPEDAQTVRRRLRVILEEVMENLTSTAHYVKSVSDLVNAHTASVPVPTHPEGTSAYVMAG